MLKLFQFIFWIILFYFFYKMIKSLIRLITGPFRSCKEQPDSVTYSQKSTIKSQDVVDVEFVEMVDDKKKISEESNHEKDKN